MTTETIEFPMGYRDEWEAIRQPLYDTREIFNGAIDKNAEPKHAWLRMFETSLGMTAGSSGRKKTFLDTNMFVPNMMPPGNEFLIQGIAVVFVPGRESPDWVDEIFEFYTESMLDLTIGQKNYLRIPCGELLPWYYADLLAAINAKSYEGLLVPMLEQRKQHSLAPTTLRLSTNQNFMVTIEHGGFPSWPNDPWRKVRVMLNGVLYRRTV